MGVDRFLEVPVVDILGRDWCGELNELIELVRDFTALINSVLKNALLRLADVLQI